MSNTITPGAIIVGAGNAYNRAVGVLTDWLTVGGTMDDTTVRIRQSMFSPDLNGMLGPVQELDYKSEEMAEIEFTMAEVAGSKLALPIAGATSAAGSNADEASSPFTSTTTAATIVGATTVSMAAVTNLAVGDYFQLDVDGSLAEYRRVTAISTLDVSFRDPLQQAHASGVAAVETVGDGKTEITGSSVRRMPATAYNEWALVAEAPDGYYEMLLDSGISVTDSAEMSFGDETVGAIRTTIQSRYAGATPHTSPWKLRVPA